jgi:hypothetical protein
MAEVWMVASGQDYEGLNSVKLMFDNEPAARRMADKINDHRRLYEWTCDMAAQGEISWDDVKSQTMELDDGTRFFVGQWAHVESIPLRSE